ncbi:craniofacial development protein 2 [Elysia marginata]|uniref:Craniofacial development protein 2 n=1 Tax=Elysia marginata TaxID=1093978 RepID=A0AAV4EXY5_9GAST|nr:craniofacial development protein 2 [Elysia marginata]
MVSLVGETWTSQTFRSVDQISVSANCKVRRIFTMKTQPPDTTDDDELYGCSSSNNAELDSIPKQCQIASDVTHLTQVLTLNKIKCAERLRSGKGVGLSEQFRPGSTLDLDLNSSGRKMTTADGKIAFGSKAPRAPDTGRKSARQGSLTTRSFRSQTSRIDAMSNSNNSASVAGVSDSIVSQEGGLMLFAAASAGPSSDIEIPRPRPPVSANAVMSGVSPTASSVPYNRQQSEPVTHEDFGFITNGVKGLMDKQIVAPHPPREPSNDRARRRPRIKSIGQNGAVARGEPSVISPRSSASVHVPPPNSGPQSLASQSNSMSPGTASIRQRLQEARASNGAQGSAGSSGKMKDSGVGPDVPEIQSPRKGESHNTSESLAYNEMDSVSDVISLLKGEEERILAESGLSMEPPKRHVEEEASHRKKRNMREAPGAGRMSGRGGLAAFSAAQSDRFLAEDNDSNVSTSASESSHLGEYEESDEETSGENNKLHLFVSPPKSANTRRNISPSNPEAEGNQSRKSFAKSFRSNIKRSTDTSSNRGARLEDDFVSHSSSDDDREAVAAELLRHHHHHHHHHHHNLGGRIRRLPGGVANGGGPGHFHRSHHNINSNNSRSNTSGYNSANYTSAASSINGSVRSRPQQNGNQGLKDSREEDKDEFYSQLQGGLSSVPKHDILMVLGDVNSKVGNNNNGFERNMGKHGLELRYDSGQRFLNLCVENYLIIGGTFFKRKKIHKETWNFPEGITRNQINLMAINLRRRSARAIGGGDIGSGHNLVLGRLKVKLRRLKKAQVLAKPHLSRTKTEKVITREEDQCTHWAEHFKEIFNRPDPEQSADVGRKARELEIKRGPIPCKEIEKAIRDSKSNRAPGEDNVTTDMLKADSEMSAKCLVELSNRVWTDDKVP